MLTMYDMGTRESGVGPARTRRRGMGKEEGLVSDLSMWNVL